MAIKDARALQKQQQMQSIERQRSNQGIVRIGDRDPVDGNYQALYSDGGIDPRGIKVFSAKHDYGDPVLATPRTDGAIGLDNLKARASQEPQRTGITAIYDKCVGYLKGQIFACGEEEPIELRKIQILYSIVADGRLQFWVGGYRKVPGFVCDFAPGTLIHMAAIHNLGGKKWVVAIEYGNPKILRRITPAIEESTSALNEFAQFRGYGYWSSDRESVGFFDSGSCSPFNLPPNGSQTCNYVAATTDPFAATSGNSTIVTTRSTTAINQVTARTTNTNYAAEIANIEFPGAAAPDGDQTYSATEQEDSDYPLVVGGNGTYSRTYSIDRDLQRQIGIAGGRYFQAESSSTATGQSQAQGTQGSTYVINSQSSSSIDNSIDDTIRVVVGRSNDAIVIQQRETANDIGTNQNHVITRTYQSNLYWVRDGTVNQIQSVPISQSWPFFEAGNLIADRYFDVTTIDPVTGEAEITAIELPTLQTQQITARAWPVTAPNPTIHASSYSP